MVTTLRRVARRVRSGRRVAPKGPLVVTEREINSFVNLTLGEQIPPELSDVSFRLGQDRLGAQGTLDLDLLRTKLPEDGMAAMLSMLTGSVPVELEGKVVSGDGLFRVELESVVIGGVSLPPSLLAQFVSLATRNEDAPGGLDIAAPVELPWTAKSVRLEPERALFEFYPPE